MASVVNRPAGHKWIQFKGPDGKRRTIRLGVISTVHAKEFSRRVGELVGCRMLGNPPEYALLNWISQLPPAMQKRLVAVGLVSTITEVHTVQDLTTEYARLADVSSGTVNTLNYVYAHLLKFFGRDRPISTITPADADEFRQWLPNNGTHKSKRRMAQTTADRRCKRVKEIFAFATSKLKWIRENPFSHMRGWKDSNRERDFYVTTDLMESVLNASTNAEFRAIVILARIAALRCPSEILPFRWDWIDWEGEWLRVRVPKNQRYKGKEIRDVPLFPLVKKYLLELQEQSDGSPLLFPNHQHTGTSLSNELGRACRSIGLPLWGKPWQNMRASRETDLLDEFPVTVVTKWVGHSPRIMQKHYAQVTKEHHARAVAGEFTSLLTDSAPTTARAKQNPKQRHTS